MKKMIYFIVLAVLCLSFGIHAQGNKAIDVTASGTQIGQTLPESFWMQTHLVYQNGKTTRQNLSAYKNKLLILDFWATWCAACIPAMYRLDSLEKQFPKDMAALPITFQDEKVIKSFEHSQKKAIHTIVSDLSLQKYFPHRSVPHQVWLKQGKVTAITNAVYANAANIKKSITGKAIDFPQKYEMPGFKPDKLLFVDGNGGSGKELLAQSMISRYVYGLDNTGNYVSNEEGFIQLTNWTIFPLYRKAFEAEIPEYPVNNRTIVEVRDKVRSRVQFTGNKEEWIPWIRENGYCYNLKLPVGVSRTELMNYMRKDLNRFFGSYLGIEAKVEKRKVLCRVLKIKGDTTLLSKPILMPSEMKDIYIQQGKPLQDFFKIYAYVNWDAALPFVNETHIEYPVSLMLNCDLKDLKAVNEALDKYGLAFVEQETFTNMLIIQDAKL